MNDVQNQHFDDIDFKTGDIVCFRWNYIDIGFRLFSKFSHVGIVIKKNSKLSILEIHPEEENDDTIRKAGVHIYDLKSRLKMYNGEYYYSKLIVPIKNKIHVNKYKDIAFDGNFRNEFVYNFISNYLTPTKSEILFKIPRPKTSFGLGKVPRPKTSFGLGKVPKKLFCSQFIGYILNDTIIKCNYKLMSPGSHIDLPAYNNLSRILI